MSGSFILRSAQQEDALHRIRYTLRRWIANPSSKSSSIDRRTSRRREEDDPLGDESPPLESVPDVMKNLLDVT
ncbi:unnamed protein product [Spirodela intermedia]|uniref:Uncharacterized protein n=1 Tax=Spirodela intermedia TaxID=51605 RepID=A0A811G788_SPIIN|nr:unnamed protein product [Spirodela intermedia]